MPKEKVTVSLAPDALRYTEHYRKIHGLKTRSEVLARALKLLRERELVEGYRAMSEDESQLRDPWLDSDLQETLHGVDER